MLLGVDIVELDRFDDLIKRRPNIINKLFTEAEISYCNKSKSPTKHFAVRFAAKEALIKAVGCGMFKMPFRFIQITNNINGKPRIEILNHKNSFIIESLKQTNREPTNREPTNREPSSKEKVAIEIGATEQNSLEKEKLDSQTTEQSSRVSFERFEISMSHSKKSAIAVVVVLD
jgi:phosphopantetheine--protein transferase-like protein